MAREIRPTTKAGRDARKGKPRRESFIPTEAQRATVEAHVACGTPYDDIRLFIKKKDGSPISLRTLSNKFKDELAIGLSKANATIAGKMFQAAKDGNITAQMFWLKTRGKWMEVQRTELTGKDGKDLPTSAQPPSGLTKAEFKELARELLDEI